MVAIIADLFTPQVVNGVLIAAAFIVGGFAVGWIFERIILTQLHRIAAKTQWRGDDMVINALRGMTRLWFMLAGVYWALRTVPLPENILELSDKALAVIVIFSATVVAARITGGLVDLYMAEQEQIQQSVSILRNVIRLVVFILGALVILQFLGISIAPILTALGVGGLAVALALQGTLANLFSGMQIVASRKVKPGDYIKLDTGEEGIVTDISWHSTTVQQLANNLVLVPNAKLAAAIVVNYNKPFKEMSVVVQVGIAYSSDLAVVERVTIDVAAEVMRQINGGIPEFIPFVRFHTFGDSSINLSVIMRAREFTEQYLLKHEFVKQLHARYAQEGIEIPFPIRTVHLRQPGDAPRA